MLTRAERLVLESAVGYLRAEVGARLSWRTLVERASGPAVAQLRATTHTLFAPLRHAGLPLLLVWGVLLLGAHAFAIWRAGRLAPPSTQR